MNVVLESLYLRRPRIEYISPAVCPVHFSASGVATFDQCFNDLAFCSANNINGHFLNFQQPADGLAYNVYYSTEETGQPFTVINSGLRPGECAVFTHGIYWFTVNTSGGESAPFPATLVPLNTYTTLPLPVTVDAISYNLYKDGVKTIADFTGAVVEASVDGWYQATKITTDGETPLSGCSALLLTGVPVPLPPPGPDWAHFTIDPQWNIIQDPHPEYPTYRHWSGGFTLGANFNALASNLLLNSATYDIFLGRAYGYYTGPTCNCRLDAILKILQAVGDAGSDLAIQILRDGVPLIFTSGPGLSLPTDTIIATQDRTGAYLFSVPDSTHSLLEVFITAKLSVFYSHATSMQGALSNVT